MREIPISKEELLEDIKPLLSLITVKVWPLIEKTEIEKIKRVASMSMLLLVKAQMFDYLKNGLKNIMCYFGFEPVYYTYLSMFYQGKLTNLDSLQLIDLLDYY